MTAIQHVDQSALVELAIVHGDLSKLGPKERTAYYVRVCESVGLNPLTKPFEYLRLSGKEVLYATRTCTDQLRQIHGVSVRITSRERVGDVYVVTATATDKHGRTDESTGAVALGNLKGESLANALMKAETKAKRRVTLSICGLGMLDESEIETIPPDRVQPGAESASETMARASEPVSEKLLPFVAESLETLRWCEDADSLAAFFRRSLSGLQALDASDRKRIWAAAVERGAAIGLEERDVRALMDEAKAASQETK